jgi:hypothetical protein
MSGFPTTVYLSDDQVKTQSSTKKFPLGTRGMTSDGRVFRYALNGASNITVGLLVMRAAVDNAEFSTGHPISTAMGTITSTWNSVDVYCTWDASSTYGADKFADGYLVTAGSTGPGQMVRLKGNTTGVGATAGQTVTLNFKEDSRLSASITTAQECGLYLNPYKGTLVNLGTTGGKSAILGVTPITVTASYYYWLQTWGLAPVLGISALSLGLPVQQDVTTSNSGYVVAQVANATGADNSGYTPACIGVCWGAGNGSALEAQIVNLMISP